jgi:hypothetical protein
MPFFVLADVTRRALGIGFMIRRGGQPCYSRGGLSPQRPGFIPRAVHVGWVCDQVLWVLVPQPSWFVTAGAWVQSEGSPCGKDLWPGGVTVTAITQAVCHRRGLGSVRGQPMWEGFVTRCCECRCHNPGGCHRRGLDSVRVRGRSIWDLWWTVWY